MRYRFVQTVSWTKETFAPPSVGRTKEHVGSSQSPFHGTDPRDPFEDGASIQFICQIASSQGIERLQCQWYVRTRVRSTSDRKIVTLVDGSASVPKLSTSDKLLEIRNRRQLEEDSAIKNSCDHTVPNITTGEFVNHAH